VVGVPEPDTACETCPGERVDGVCVDLRRFAALLACQVYASPYVVVDVRDVLAREFGCVGFVQGYDSPVVAFRVRLSCACRELTYRLDRYRRATVRLLQKTLPRLSGRQKLRALGVELLGRFVEEYRHRWCCPIVFEGYLSVGRASVPRTDERSIRSRRKRLREGVKERGPERVRIHVGTRERRKHSRPDPTTDSIRSRCSSKSEAHEYGMLFAETLHSLVKDLLQTGGNSGCDTSLMLVQRRTRNRTLRS